MVKYAVNKIEAKPFFQKSLEALRHPIRILKRPDIQPYIDEAYKASLRRAYAEGFTVIDGDNEATRVDLKLNESKFTALWMIRNNADGRSNRLIDMYLHDSRFNANPLRRLRISHIEPALQETRPIGDFEYGEYDELHGERILPVSGAYRFLEQISNSKVDREATYDNMEDAIRQSQEGGRQLRIGWARDMNAFGIKR